MSCSCVVSLDKNFDSFHSEQVHVWVPATHHTAGGNPVRGWGRGGGQQCSNIPIHLGLSCYWNRDKLPTVQASIAQVRFYQRGNIGRDSTKKMHFGVASALVCSHLAHPDQSRHKWDKPWHQGFSTPSLFEQRQGSFYVPSTWHVRMIFHFNDKSEEFANVNYNLFVSVLFYK